MRDAHTEPKRRWLFHTVLIGIVTFLVVGTTLSIVLLWPEPDQVMQTTNASDPDGEFVTARVTNVTATSCESPEVSASAKTSPDHALAPGTPGCLDVRAQLPVGKTVTLSVRGPIAQNLLIYEGDTVRLIAHEVRADGPSELSYSFYDIPRSGKMLTVAIIFAIIVVVVGRWRGALALVGVGAATGLLAVFVLPAILAGKPPVLVAVAGAIGIMVIVLYLAHGLTHRTTAALFGSVFGILFTAIAGFFTTRWLRFTGISSTEDASLVIAVPALQMSDVLTATIVIAGLGILNDITVAQASAVWEMRSLNPNLPKRQLYMSAMRVGRDHIASSIYTLVFAYAGAMFVILLLLYTYPRDLLDLVTTEQIGQEIIRTLIGAAGLVLSMPVTTAFAVLFARSSRTLSPDSMDHCDTLVRIGKH